MEKEKNPEISNKTLRRKIYLVSDLNYQTTKCLSENLLATEKKKIKLVINKPVYLGLLILDISKIAMYEFCYNMKPKYGEKAQ